MEVNTSNMPLYNFCLLLACKSNCVVKLLRLCVTHSFCSTLTLTPLSRFTVLGNTSSSVYRPSSYNKQITSSHNKQMYRWSNFCLVVLVTETNISLVMSCEYDSCCIIGFIMAGSTILSEMILPMMQLNSITITQFLNHDEAAVPLLSVTLPNITSK